MTNNRIFSDVLNEYATVRTLELRSAASIKGFQKQVVNWHTFANQMQLSNLAVNALTAEHVVLFYDWARAKLPTCSPLYADKHVRMLQATCRMACERGYLECDQIGHLQTPFVADLYRGLTDIRVVMRDADCKVKPLVERRKPFRRSVIVTPCVQQPFELRKA